MSPHSGFRSTYYSRAAQSLPPRTPSTHGTQSSGSQPRNSAATASSLPAATTSSLPATIPSVSKSRHQGSLPSGSDTLSPTVQLSHAPLATTASQPTKHLEIDPSTGKRPAEGSSSSFPSQPSGSVRPRDLSQHIVSTVQPPRKQPPMISGSDSAVTTTVAHSKSNLSPPLGRTSSTPSAVTPNVVSKVSDDITKWCAALRSIDIALTDHLNLYGPKYSYGGTTVSPYTPDPLLPHHRFLSSNNIPAHSPLAIPWTSNPTILMSAYLALGTPPPNISPGLTISPCAPRPPVPPTPLNTTPSRSPHDQVAPGAALARPETLQPSTSETALPKPPVTGASSLSTSAVLESQQSLTTGPLESSSYPTPSHPMSGNGVIVNETRDKGAQSTPMEPSSQKPRQTDLTEEQQKRFVDCYIKANTLGKEKLITMLQRNGLGNHVEAVVRMAQAVTREMPTVTRHTHTAPAALPSPSSLPNSKFSTTRAISSSSKLVAALGPPVTEESSDIVLPVGVQSPAPPSTSLSPACHSAKQNSHTSKSPISQELGVCPTSKPGMPRPSNLDPTLTKMVQAMLNRGPQPLPVLLTAFSRLNSSNKDSIMTHIQALARPLSKQTDGLWELREPAKSVNGTNLLHPTRSQVKASGILHPSSSSTVIVHPSTSSTVISADGSLRQITEPKNASQAAPRPSSSLAGALQTGFPIHQPPSICATKPVPAPIPTSLPPNCSSPTAFSPTLDLTNLDSLEHNIRRHLPVQFLPAIKRGLPSDGEDASTDTSNPPVTLDQEGDMIRSARSTRRRLDPHLESSSCDLGRSMRPRRALSPLPPPLTLTSTRPEPEPFEDDLPGFPFVDRTIQIAGTRARILAKYEPNEQMAPFRTFVPMGSRPVGW